MDRETSPVMRSQPEMRTEARFYRAELDVLRFFAFFSVFLAHILQPSNPRDFTGIKSALISFEWDFRNAGGFGLCLFFLLSAYLITELLLRELSRTGAIHFRAFYLRRMLRIWPLYFLMVIFGYFFGLIRPRSVWGFDRLVAYVFMFGNYYTARHGQAQNPAGPLWSISIEEQFYSLWPSIAKYGVRCLVIMSSLLIPFSYFWLYVLFRAGTSLEQGIWTNSIVQFQFFGIGALLALWLQGNTPNLGHFVRIAMLFAGVALWLFASGFFRILGWGGFVPVSQIMMGYGCVALGCVLLLVGILGCPKQWCPGRLVYLGKISYGLYVFHQLGIRIGIRSSNALAAHFQGGSSISSAMLALRIPVALTSTIIFAYVSYKFIETPFLRIKERFAFIKSRDI